MNKNNEVVRDRWKREDEIHAEENRPKIEFGLNRRSDSHIKLWYANLGTVSFLVSEMLIDPVNPWNDSKQLKVPIIERIQLVVPTGEMRSTPIDVSQFKCRIRNAGVTLSLQGPSGELIATGEKPYFLHLIDGKIIDVIDGEYSAKKPLFGLQSKENIFCPKCHAHIADFSVEGMMSAPDCRSEIAEVKHEFESSCPSHTSTNSRVTLGA